MKTIKEAAKEAINANNYFMADPSNPSFVDRGIEQFRAMMWMANYIMSLPLADRLTDKEKAVIKKAYAGMRSYGKSQSSECNKCANYVAEVWMNRIFSKEFAKNEAEELLDKLNEK